MALRSASLLTDARNVELLRVLSAAPRSSVSALARRVGLSAPAVRERLRRLTEAGLIRGYRVDLDPNALGFPLAAFVRVRPMPGKLSKIIELAQRLPQVTECHRVTGEDCFILRVHFESLGGLDRILDQFLAFGQTTTSLVQSTPVALRPLPLPGERRR
jgi:Lrp/AsnC family transcriptional regulator, leucine-responsive regulatory protein